MELKILNWQIQFKIAIFFYSEKEIRRIELNNEDIKKFKPLIKLYDRADIINDIA